MILVTGACGYIGSHTVFELLAKGEKVVALDSLYSGFKQALPDSVPLVIGSTGDLPLLHDLFRKYPITSVIHFAAHLDVEESTREPLKYYQNNFSYSLSLVDVCLSFGVKEFIFSSSCAVYGAPEHSHPEGTPGSGSGVSEDASIAPINPYGASKAMVERLLSEVSQKNPDFRTISLRYFNVAGANLEARLGQSTPKATQLIKVASEVALKKRSILKVFGTDYPTRDGSAIRDYLHVQDLAQAHVLSLEYLRAGNPSDTFNCGYGKGFSVWEVIETMNQILPSPLPVEKCPRRAGDAPAIFANPSRIKEKLGWAPQFDDLRRICQSSFEWEQRKRF